MARPGLTAFGTLKQVGPSEERSDVDILLTEGIYPGQASGAEWGTHQGELNLRCGARTAQGPTGEGEAPIEAKPTLRTSLSHPPLKGGVGTGEQALGPAARATFEIKSLVRLISSMAQGLHEPAYFHEVSALPSTPLNHGELLRNSLNGSQCYSTRRP